MHDFQMRFDPFYTFAGLPTGIQTVATSQMLIAFFKTKYQLQIKL